MHADPQAAHQHSACARPPSLSPLSLPPSTPTSLSPLSLSPSLHPSLCFMSEDEISKLPALLSSLLPFLP